MIKKNHAEGTCPMRGMIPGILGATLLLVIVNLVMGFNMNKQIKDLYKSQIGQLGGVEVLNTLSEKLWDTAAYQQAQVENIQEYLSQMGDLIGEDTGAAQPSQPSSNNKSFNIDQLEQVIGNQHIMGNPDGDAVLVVYADFLCSYCNRLHNDGTIEAIAAENDNVAVVIKHVALFGDQSVPGAKAAYCVSQLGTAEQYFNLIDAGYDAQVQSADGALALATGVGISEKDFTECYNDKATTDAVNAIYAEGVSSFGISGTPATVVINKTTGAYQLVGGALPKASFESTISAVL